jgi:serine/threonine protein kinase
VKAVSKSYFKQDPKVKENLEREIRIMKLLKNCEYVVRLEHVQDLKQHIVLVMELCDYDLDHLVKVSPFREDDITLFLFQLSKGMKALREQNIVHRDLKPGNILIKKDQVTGKIKIKLADFGFARHFTEEGTKKPIDMHSLAGTPVFMAPEALRCVFYPGEHYDDKVDIWSIGALLYKVIVGQCGFYAQLQDIPKILKHKKDAIAFERLSSKVIYIQELPPSVYDRFSGGYRAKMNALLKSLLKLDPQERMSFPDFFEFVDDLVTSKIEVVNLLTGTSGKILYDSGMTMEQLRNEVHTQLGVKETHQLMFSSASLLYLSPHSALSPAQFSELMEQCGASRGNGVLYLLPTGHLESSQPFNLSCLTQLKFAVSDQHRCVEQITDHKLSKEIVHEISSLRSQQLRQESGVREFRKFCYAELQNFKRRGGYQQLARRGVKTAAKLSLAAELLANDLASTSTEEAQRLVQRMRQLENEVESLVKDLDTLYEASEQQLSVLPTESREGASSIESMTADLTKTAKLLPELRKVEMFGRCQDILRRCENMAKQTGVATRNTLVQLYTSITKTWDMARQSQQLSQLCQQSEELLTKQLPPVRATLVTSVTSRDVPLLSPSTPSSVPPVLVTPPGWPHPPPSIPYQPSPNSPSRPSPQTPQPQVAAAAGDPKAIAELREDRDFYEALFQSKAEECGQLSKSVEHLKEMLGQQRNRAGSSLCEEEKTLGPGTTLTPTAGPGEDRSLRASLSSEDHKLLEGLREQLKSFCTIADRIRPGTPVDRSRSQTSPSSRKVPHSPGLYPPLGAGGGSPDLTEYSIITMASSPDRQNSEGALSGLASPDNIELLLPHASQLMGALKDGLKDLGQSLAMENSVSGERAFVKIARPREYIQGDLALFNPIRLPKSKTTIPIILHTEKPCPYIFMDTTSYSSFGIRPGRIPELIVARLTERPRAFRFEEDREMATEFPDIKGEFYRVRVEPTPFKFLQSKAPPRPPPPTKNKFFGSNRA